MVVAVPKTVRIQRNQEEIGSLQIFQDFLAGTGLRLSMFAGLDPGHGIAEGSAEILKYGSLEEKILYFLWLVVEDFLHQIIQNIAITAGKVIDEKGYFIRSCLRNTLEASAAICRPAIQPSVRSSKTGHIF